MDRFKRIGFFSVNWYIHKVEKKVFDDFFLFCFLFFVCFVCFFCQGICLKGKERMERMLEKEKTNIFGEFCGFTLLKEKV